MAVTLVNAKKRKGLSEIRKRKYYLLEAHSLGLLPELVDGQVYYCGKTHKDYVILMCVSSPDKSVHKLPIVEKWHCVMNPVSVISDDVDNFLIAYK